MIRLLLTSRRGNHALPADKGVFRSVLTRGSHPFVSYRGAGLFLFFVLLFVPREELSAAPTSNDSASEAKVEEILRRPMFQQWRRRIEASNVEPSTLSLKDYLVGYKPYLDWFGEKLKAIVEWLRNLWRSNPSPAATSSAGSMATVLEAAGWILLIALGLLLLFFIWQITRATKLGTPPRVLSRHQVIQAMEAGEALALSGQDWLKLADEYFKVGDFRSLYRALYLALLAGLHQAHRIDFRRTRTNWYYVHRFRGTDQDRDSFRSLTEMFDEIWYGGRSAEQDALGEVRERVKTLLSRGSYHA